jgi:hypothetical protein
VWQFVREADTPYGTQLRVWEEPLCVRLGKTGLGYGVLRFVMFGWVA